jgi:TrmH family RNA methyltransferase
VLSSPKNPKVVAAARLKKRSFREADRLFLVEGAQGVSEALERRGALESLFTLDPMDPLAARASQAGVAVHEVGEEAIRAIASTVTPQGVVGVCPFLDVPFAALPVEGCLAILHEVRDPGNAGTVVRSADAVGADGVVFTAASVDVYNPKTVRSSAGSVFHLPVVREVDIADALASARAHGRRIIAMAADGQEDLYRTDLSGPIALVFGNEAAGLPDEIRSMADGTVSIPQGGRAESLNMAAAATVCLFEWQRRRLRDAEALDNVVSAAAHDIRSPLTAMKGFGYALEKRWEVMTEEQRSVMLQGIVHDADRMDTILRQLVDSARIVGGNLELFPEQLDMGAMVSSIAEAQRRDPDHPPIEWSGEGVVVFLDPARLRTSVLAFIESLVWWGHDGPVLVHAERIRDTFTLTASRDGSDIDDDQVEQLFVPRRPGEGAGSKIGLFVARGVAEAQGGRAWAEVEDRRLTFHLELPVGL